nr:NADH oxidase [Ipomoea batatas]
MVISSGELLGSLGFQFPIRSEENDEHGDHTGRLRRQESEPEPLEVEAGEEAERDGDRHSDEVKTAEVDVGAGFRPRRPPEHAAAGGLRAVSDLAEANNGENQRGQCDNFRVEGEHFSPNIPDGDSEEQSSEPQNKTSGEADNGGAFSVSRLPRAQLVPHSRGNAEAERRRENVDQRSGDGVKTARKGQGLNIKDRIEPLPRRLYFLAPKACPQIGSIPMAKPERMEYPVMLAKPTAREPPANASPPRRPRKSMEIMEREYRRRPVRIMGRAILAMDSASLITRERLGAGAGDFNVIRGKASTSGFSVAGILIDDWNSSSYGISVFAVL